jgi:hypothetical protein
VINNNILMMKIMKKAMVTHARDTFEDSLKRPREYHLINQNLLRKLSEKYVYGARMQSRRVNRKHKSINAMQSLKT